MAEEDQRVRTALAATGALFQGYHPDMRAVHDANAARLGSIVAEHGWPGTSRVGHDGGEAAWLVVQHAIAQPALQRRALEALSAAVEHEEAPAWQAAMLEDRIRIFEGRPQRYGTQFDWDADGVLSPLAIEDPAGLAARRRAVGLRPLEDDLHARRRESAEGGERPPADWAERRREEEAWLREIGWRE